MVILIIALIAVLVIIFCQVRSFLSTKKGIARLKMFFPPINEVSLRVSTINKSDLASRDRLKRFIQNPPSPKDISNMTDDDSEVSLIETGQCSNGFKEVIDETNEYLCKNVGTSADLAVLQDICEKKIDIIENGVKSTLNLPLFIGLAGTFIGIIIGVIGFAIDINSLFNTTTNSASNSLQYLLYGIGLAMIASLCGLLLTIFNTAWMYKKATAEIETKKNEYFDFLRRELMPTLANSMSSSLNSLKGVLGHFVDKFGRNLDAYADSAELLNDNLEKQHLVLEQINNMGMTRMASKIATSFTQLSDAADALNVFYQYQKELSATMQQVQGGVSKIDSVLRNFDDFISILKSVANAQSVALELQHQFKEAIEQHFPTGSEGREIWRKEFDQLLIDAQKVSTQLNAQLAQNTTYVQQFVSENKQFFSCFDEMRNVLSSLVSYAKIQGDCYQDLKDEILSLRKDTKDSQRETAELHKSLLEAVKEMTKAVRDYKDYEKAR